MQKDYRSLKLLGEGAFGQVYLMRHVPTQHLVCVKACKEGKDGPVPWREVNIMQSLCHPCIVRYRDNFGAGGMLYIVMQYADKGDLSFKLKAARRSTPRMHFPETQIWHWFSQLCLALEYMHARKIIHRDIKPPNIFLLGPDERLVLGDVGVAKNLDTTKAFAHTGIGTPYYMAPEIFANKGHNTKADVWSLGVLLYELAYLRQAFDGESVQEIGNKVVSGRFHPVMSEDNHRYSSALGDVLIELLNVNPNRRPPVADLLKTRPVITRRAQEWSKQVLLAAADPEIEKGVDVSAEQKLALQLQIKMLWPAVAFAASVPSASSSSFSYPTLSLPSSSSSSSSSFPSHSSSATPRQPKSSFSSLSSSSSSSVAAAAAVDAKRQSTAFQESDLQQVLEKLRKERSARLESSLMTMSISEAPLMSQKEPEKDGRAERWEEQKEGDVGGISKSDWLPTSVPETSSDLFPLASAARNNYVRFPESQESKRAVRSISSGGRPTASGTASTINTEEEQQQQQQQPQHHHHHHQQQQQQQQRQHHVHLDGVWSELGSPTLGVGMGMGGMEDAFGRFPLTGTTPKSHHHPMHLTCLGEQELQHQVAEEQDQRAEKIISRSAWASDIAVVLVSRLSQHAVAGGAASPRKGRGVEPEDEGVYFVKNVTPDGKQGPKGSLRELHRVADHIQVLSGSSSSVPQQMISTLGGGRKAGGQPSVLLDQYAHTLGLSRDAYTQEDVEVEGVLEGRTRPAQCLMVGWNPTGPGNLAVGEGGMLEVKFPHRPSGTLTLSEGQAALVMRPLGSGTGAWMEMTLNEFARQGQRLCTGDLLALLVGAVMKARRDAVLVSRKDGEGVSYDPDQCLSNPGYDLPLEVLEGPLTALVSDPRAAFKVASFFLGGRVDEQGRARFTPAAFVHFCNCFMASQDLFGTAFKVWEDLGSLPSGVEFRRFEGQMEGGKGCFLHLSDVAPCMVLDWYSTEQTSSRSSPASPPPAPRPKGLLLRWADGGSEGRLVWEVEEPQLKALLTEQATVLGLDPTSLSGLVTAAQELRNGIGEKAGQFNEILIAVGKQQASRRYIGVSIC